MKIITYNLRGVLINKVRFMIASEQSMDWKSAYNEVRNNVALPAWRSTWTELLVDQLKADFLFGQGEVIEDD
jgi:hypothetical protein